VVLTLLMWVPLLMIEHTVGERAARRDSVQQEVAESLAGELQIWGPVMVVPYQYSTLETVTVGEEGGRRKEERWVKYSSALQVIPSKLHVSSQLVPAVLTRGIFKTVTYQTETVLEGDFTFNSQLPAHVQNVEWQNASISIGLNESRGLTASPELEWNQAKINFEPGVSTRLFKQGVQADLGKLNTDSEQTYHFKVILSLRGTKRFYVAPIARQFQFDLKSDWPHPSFTGHFLPVSREVTETGFSASWRLTDFATHARLLENCSANSDTCGLKISEDTFGVALIDPVDNYLQAERAVKYGFLFIVLTFSAVFLTETLRKQAVHPIQYLFVGVALALFFLLLLALSEHLTFLTAYCIASVACVTLIGFYMSHVLAQRIAGGFAGALLAVLYGVMYQLLQSEDMALLLGSSLLFGLLALVMVVTRRVNWFEITALNPVN
ncbi:MAG TPA: cell envelope integrity protein CreD, partial [Pseudomonadales bacterium]|nr:cell envelope integrity protein CreD [Pseudomonadales bacterium]